MISSSPSRDCSDPATAAEYASMLMPVNNAEAINQGKAKPEEIGAKAIDDNTLEVTLNAPTPYFLEMLTHQATYPCTRRMSRSSATTGPSPATWCRTALIRWPSSCPTITSSWSRIRNSTMPPMCKIDTVNYIPNEDRSAAVKRLRGRRTRQLRRHADRAAGRHQGEIRRSGAYRSLSRHLLLCVQDRQGAVGRCQDPARHFYGHRPRLHRREGLVEQHDPRLFDGASGDHRLRNLDHSTIPKCRRSTARTKPRRF